MAEPFPDVVFRIPASQLQEFLEALRVSDAPIPAPKVVPSAGASGGGDMVAVLVQLAPHGLTFIAGLVTAWMSRPRASIEVDGIKVQNVSRDLVEEILRERLLDHERPGGEPVESDEKQ